MVNEFWNTFPFPNRYSIHPGAALIFLHLLEGGGEITEFYHAFDHNELPRSKLRGIEKQQGNYTPMQASRNSLIKYG